MIDEVPLLFVLASFAKGVTFFYGLKELKLKESDRIRSMQSNLKRMGVVLAKVTRMRIVLLLLPFDPIDLLLSRVLNRDCDLN